MKTYHNNHIHQPSGLTRWLSFPALLLIVALANSVRADNNYEFIDPLTGPADTNGWAQVIDFPGVQGSFTIANGGYRLQVSGDTTIAAVSTYRPDLIYTNFKVSVDVIDWDRRLWPTNFETINIAGRAQNFTFGSTTPTGYLFFLRPNGDTIVPYDGQAEVGIFGFNSGNLLFDVDTNFSINLTHQYRLVFTGDGSSLTGQIFDLTNLVQPVVTVHVTDSTITAGGNVGIFADDDAAVDGLGHLPVDFTVNNFQAGPPTPVLNIQQTNNGFSDSLATAADTNGWADAGDFGISGVAASFTITNGGYRLQASSDNPEIVPILETYPTNLVYTNFQVSLDVVDWDRRPYPANLGGITLFARAHGLDTAPSGYLFYFGPNDTNNDGMGQIGIIDVTNATFGLQTNLSCPVNITNGQYRLVFTGSGSLLTGQLFNLTNLIQPVATVQMIDNIYASGNVGIVAFSGSDSSVVGSPVDFTVNNFTAGPLPLSQAVSLSWPDSYAGYSLQTMTNLDGTWQPLNVIPQDSGSIYTATTDETNSVEFFRLVQP